MTAPAPSLRDPYAILGVAPSASEGEIRDGLMRALRKLRMEREPIALRRLQAAYAIVQHESTRAELAAIVTPKQEGSSTLRDSLLVGLDAFAVGDWLRVQLNLQQAIELGATDALTHHCLGLALLYGDRGPEGVRELDAARTAQPEHPGFWLHRAEATLALGAPADALPLFQHAAALDPQTPFSQLGISQCHARLKEPEKALAALAHLTSWTQPHDLDELELVIVLRRIELLAALPDKDKLRALIDELREGLKKDDGTGKQRYATERLVGLIEREVKDPQDLDDGAATFAGWLLQQVQRLPWVRTAQLSSVVPSRLAPLAALPEALQKRLIDLPSDPPVYYSARPVSAGPTWLLAALCLVFALPLMMILDGELASSNHLAATIGLALFGTFALAGRAIRIGRAPLGSYYAIHSFFLLRAHLDEVLLLPLCHLRRTQITDVYVNGTYRSSTIAARFTDMSMSFSVVGESEARLFVDGLLWGRSRALVRCRLGLLPAEESYDALPATGELPPEASRALGIVRRYVPAALLAALATLGLSFYSRNKAEEARWERQMERGAAGCREYLAERPRGRHADEARALLHKSYTDALAAYQAFAAPRARPEALAAVAKLLAAAEAAKDPLLRVEFSRDLKGLSSQPPAQSGQRPLLPDPARVEKERTAWEGELTASLRRLFSAREQLLKVRDARSPNEDEDEAADAQPMARADVRYTARLIEPLLPVPMPSAEPDDDTGADEEAQPQDAAAAYSVQVDFELSLTLAGESAPIYRFAATAHSVPGRELPRSMRESGRELAMAQRLSSHPGSRAAVAAIGATTEHFIRLLRADLGFSEPPPPEPPLPQPAPEPEPPRRGTKRRP